MEDFEVKLWNYLKRKFKFLDDNNKTAREVFDKVIKLKVE